MAEQVFIRLSDRSDQVWMVALNDDGHLVDGPDSMSLTEAADRAAGSHVTVMLPARDIVSTLAKVPAASQSRLRQMLPFSLEDDFAGDVDELHFAAGSRNDNDELAVSVIARDRLDYWLSRLKGAGIDARRIVSEADPVPDTPGAVTLFLEGRGVLGRRAGGAPFYFEELTLADLWQLLSAEREAADDLTNAVVFVDHDTHEQRKAEIDAWQQHDGDVNVKELADGCLPKLASGLVFEPGTNLLQGDYALRSDVGAMLRPWRAAAGFVLILVAVSLVGKGAEVFKLSREQAELDRQAAAVCSESYSSGQLSRCLVEMGRRLNDSGQVASASGQGFLPMLSAVAAMLDDAMSINQIGYRDGTLTLDLITPNVSYLNAFDQRLTESGQFALDIDNASPEADGSVSSMVRIVAQNP